MAVPVFNYAAMPDEGDPLMKGLIPALQQGMQLKYMKPMMQNELQRQQLANALSQVQLNYADPMAQADLGLKQSQSNLMGQQANWYGPDIQSQIGLRGAQANLANREAALPFGGKYPPGVAGQVLGLEAVRQMYGEGSPQYKQALDSFNLGQDSDRSRINYQNVLASSMPVRALTPTGKSIVEESNVGSGLMPTGQQWRIPLQPNTMQQNPNGGSFPAAASNNAMASTLSGALQAPASPQDLASQYALLRQKNTTDTDTRKRNLFATNIEKTLNNINVDDLVQYSGLSGMAKLATDKTAAAFGKTNDSYEKYNKSLQAAEMLATQVRQFYGDSVQPSMIQRLQTITNPSAWSNNPELAKAMFNQTKNILGQEMQTYRDALKSPNVYQGLMQSLTLSPQQGQQLANAGMAKPANQNFSAQQVQQMAQEAISKGADPRMVQQRMQQLMGGQ